MFEITYKDKTWNTTICETLVRTWLKRCILIVLKFAKTCLVRTRLERLTLLDLNFLKNSPNSNQLMTTLERATLEDLQTWLVRTSLRMKLRMSSSAKLSTLQFKLAWDRTSNINHWLIRNVFSSNITWNSRFCLTWICFFH
jgi:hypothetical protein